MTRHDSHDHGDGLHEDLVKLASRRDALKLFGAAGAASTLTTLGAPHAFAGTPTAEVPTETAGPYPGDGSNGPDVLDESGIVRHDTHRSPAPPSTCGTAIARAGTRCIRQGWRTRTTCAASPRPTATAPRGSRPPSRAVTRAAGRTSTSSAANLAGTSLSRDMVFGDDKAIHQLATVTGSTAKGFVANLTIGV